MHNRTSFPSVEKSKAARARPGMTLIEVLVALIILGTLLASAVTARARYVAQSVKAQQRQRAVLAADGLLAQWSEDWSSQDHDAGGPVPNEPNLTWTRQIFIRQDASDLGAKILHLEIHPDPESRGSYAPPLAMTEVLIPLKPVPPKDFHAVSMHAQP